MVSNKYDKENFEKIIASSDNITDATIKLGLKPRGGNFLTIKKYISKYKLDTSHFVSLTPKRLEILKKCRNSRSIDLKDILVEDRRYNSSLLKKRLFNTNLKNNICEICGQTDIWFGKKISLILDHIDGNHNNNKIENLRILCPNCNASLETHCGRNKKKIEHLCKCGNVIKKKSSTCRSCYHIANRKVKNRPNIDILLSDYSKLGYVKTGKKYGVSDRTIKKWINTAI